MMESKPVSGEVDRKAQIAGWLRFLIVYLRFLVPIGFLLSGIGFALDFYQFHGYGPSIGDGEFGVQLLFEIPLVIYAVVCASYLANQFAPASVWAVKRYFYLVIVWNVVHPAVSLTFWNENSAHFIKPSMLDGYENSIPWILPGVLIGCAWLLYLRNSSRVRSAYFG